MTVRNAVGNDKIQMFLLQKHFHFFPISYEDFHSPPFSVDSSEKGGTLLSVISI